MKNNKQWDFLDGKEVSSIQEIAEMAIGIVITMGLFFSLLILSAAFI